MSEEKKDNTNNEELVKALGNLFSEEEIKDLLSKGKKEDYDDEQGEVPGEQDTGPDEYEDDDMKKAKEEYDKAEKAMKAAKDKLEKMKKSSYKKGEEDELNKGEEKEGNKEEILKGLVDLIGNKVSESNNEIKEEIQKSFDALKEKQESLEQEWGKFANQPKGLKSQKASHYIEKSEDSNLVGEDESKTLSLSKNKAEVEKAIEDIILTSPEDRKAEYEDQLMAYNSGGSVQSLSKSLLMDLQKANEGVTFTK